MLSVRDVRSDVLVGEDPLDATIETLPISNQYEM